MNGRKRSKPALALSAKYRKCSPSILTQMTHQQLQDLVVRASHELLRCSSCSRTDDGQAGEFTLGSFTGYHLAVCPWSCTNYRGSSRNIRRLVPMRR